MKIIIKLLRFSLFLMSILSYSQVEVSDVLAEGDPSLSEGSFGNLSTENINLPNGKVNFSVPLASVAPGRLSSAVTLSFSGGKALKNVNRSNKFNPTGIIGLGWNINTSKIVCDNKKTGYRGDDDFFLSESGSQTRLICIKKQNSNLYEFKAEGLPNWKINYMREDNYWLVVKDNGDSYYYGDINSNASNASNENIIAWNNWIGNSKEIGGIEQTNAWNLSKISNQWNDEIQFYYTKIDQAVQPDNLGPKHTEAIYLSKIESNNGYKIELNYLDKTDTNSVQEYQEPHKEINEPDAYQEYYQKKYLDKVVLKNSNGLPVYSYDLDYEVYGDNLMAKRYLTKVTMFNSVNESLKPQIFEYNTNGLFKGTLKKIKNTTGYEIEYQYDNKLLFNNSANRFHPDFLESTNYEAEGGNYDMGLKNKNLTENYVIADTDDGYRVLTWDGEYWTVKDHGGGSPSIGDYYYKFSSSNNLLQVFSPDTDGHSFKEQAFTIDGSNFESIFFAEDYILLFSENHQVTPYFDTGKEWVEAKTLVLPNDGSEIKKVKLQRRKGAFLWFSVTYIREADNWEYTHHFILSKTLEGAFNLERIFEGVVVDEYARTHTIHDENFELSEITLSKNLFHSNFKYNRIHSNTMFFNGVDFVNISHPSISNTYCGEDKKLYRAYDDSSLEESLRSRVYDPNTNSVSDNFIYDAPNDFVSESLGIYELDDYLIYGTSLLKKNSSYNLVAQFYNPNKAIYPIGYQGSNYNALIQSQESLSPGNEETHKSWYIYIKKDGSIGYVELPDARYSLVTTDTSGGASYKRLGINNSTLFLQKREHFRKQDLYRLIDNEINQDVYDIVVKSVNIFDGDSQNLITEFSFNLPNVLPNNATTYYGEVIIEKKGLGNSGIGKVTNYYNTGDEDLRLAGLLEQTLMKDIEGKKVSEKTNEYSFASDILLYNSENTSVKVSGGLQLDKVTNKSYFYNEPQVQTFENSQEIEYNEKGLVSKMMVFNSKGEKEELLIDYAYESSSSFVDANMLKAVKQRTSKINNIPIKVALTEWKNELGKLYPIKRYSGTKLENIKLDTETTRLSNSGKVEESTNGKGIFSVDLLGYNNKHSVATIYNSTFNDVVNALDVSYNQLQGLNTIDLKVELLKLYDALPNGSIKLSFYNENGKTVNQINERKEEVYFYYDSFGRLDYKTDAEGNILEKKEYHFSN